MTAVVWTGVAGSILLPIALWFHSAVFGAESMTFAVLWLVAGHHFVLVPLGVVTGVLRLTNRISSVKGTSWMLPWFAWLYLVACSFVYLLLETGTGRRGVVRLDLLFPCIFLGMALLIFGLGKLFRRVSFLKACLVVFCLIALPVTYAEALSEEKGDLVFRYKAGWDWSGVDWFSHTGVYYKYIGVGDPMDFKNHLVIESVGGILTNEPGVVMHTFEYFYYYTTFLDGRTKNPGYAQRNTIIDLVSTKIGLPYRKVIGYKGPDGFRCDGLAEFAYESVGIDIVQDSGPTSLTPDAQRSAMALARPSSPQLVVKDASGNVIPDGGTIWSSSVTVEATDGDRGSGLSRFEMWNGLPTMGGSELTQYRNVTNYDFNPAQGFDHVYSLADLPEGHLWARSIDQAGNETWVGFTTPGRLFLV